MFIEFAMRETVYNRYSIEVPDELADKSDEEIQQYISEHPEDREFEKFLDNDEGEFAFEYEFERLE